MQHTNVGMATPMACYPIKIESGTGNILIKYNFASMPKDDSMFLDVYLYQKPLGQCLLPCS